METGTTPYTADRETDTTAIRAVLDAAVEAWNRGDGTAYGRLFTPDATDVTFVGTVYTGGGEIGRAHQALFDSFLKGTKLAVEIVSIRRYGPATAVVLTRGDTYKGAWPARLGKLASYTLVREAATEQWRIAAVQKTRHRPWMEALSFRFQPATRPTRRPTLVQEK